ncbi:unnamed protein product [Spirodela intermedia]|uniref:Uncharacterized protein n=1 Tax=Spirodela intermedia TaxID=51605 RepID=A0A7I8LGV7_SPIIN|nr:unnamed protein product [Spirodela intermedia]
MGLMKVVPFRRVTYGCLAGLLASFLLFFFFSAGGEGNLNVAAAYSPSNLLSWFLPAPHDGSGWLDPTGSRPKKKGVGRRGNRSSGRSQSEKSHEALETHRLQGSCDIFSGRWIRDDRKPLYDPGSCPIVDPTFSCHENGRPDQEFLNWRWQPNDCDIPRLNAKDFLQKLRGQRLVFVGDSLNRNMWESLVCILRNGLNESRVYEESGTNDFKASEHISFRFMDYNCSVELVRSPYLVRVVHTKAANGERIERLSLDLMEKASGSYRDADIIIFNTGHWWNHVKTKLGVDYYQEGGHVYPVLPVMAAYKKALSTWARWIDENIDPNKTQVVFRGISPSHFRGGNWNTGGRCHGEREPIFNETFLRRKPVPKLKALKPVFDQMKTPVIFLNISRLTEFRKDAHPSIYGMKYASAAEAVNAVETQDCSHWCLPGLPDTWNELLYASLLMAGRGTWKS